jgi:hypothetical protein
MEGSAACPYTTLGAKARTRMLQPAGSSLQYKGRPPCLHMSLLVLLEIFTRRTYSSLKRRLLCVVESNGRCWLFEEDRGHSCEGVAVSVFERTWRISRTTATAQNNGFLNQDTRLRTSFAKGTIPAITAAMDLTWLSQLGTGFPPSLINGEPRRRQSHSADER